MNDERSIRVLIVEDRPDDAELMAYELRRAGFDPDWQRVDNEADFIAHLDSNLDLILADHNLPQFDSRRAVQLLQERDLDIPLIAVTGTMSDEMAVEYLKQGAVDYLLKDRLARLGPAAEQALAEKQLREQKQQTEVELQESETRYRRLVELSPDGIAVHSDGELVFINSAGARLMGASSPAELLGRNVIDFVHPDYLDLVRQRQAEVEAGNVPAPLEEKFVRLDGLVIDVEVVSVPFTYRQQPAVQVVFRDITERKRMQERLAYQAHLLRNINDAVIATDDQFNITAWNRAAEETYGWSAEEVVGRRVGEVLYSDMGQAELDAARHRLIETGHYRTEWVQQRRDGQSIYIEGNTIALRGQDGQITGYVSVNRDITARKEAEQALQRQLTELTVLHAVAAAGAETVNVDELIDQVTEIIGQMLYPDNFGIGLVEEKTGLLRAHQSYHGLTEWLDGETIPLGQGVAGQVASTGQPRRVPDVTREPAYVAVHPGMRSELCVPLKVGKKVIGVINAESAELDAFSEADERLLLTVAGQLATAIDRIRLFEATRRRAEELEVLAEVSAALRKAQTRQKMVPVVLDLLLKLLNVSGAALALPDPATSELLVELGRGIASKLKGCRLPLGDRVMATGEPYATPDAQDEPELSQLDEGQELRAVACVPLIAHEQTIGVLWVSRHSPISPEEVRLLRAIGDIAANAIHRATLHEEAEQHVQHLTALRNIDLAITASPDLNVTLDVLLEQVVVQLGVDAVSVSLLDQETETLSHAASRGFRTDEIGHTKLKLGQGYMGQAALQGQIIHISDLAAKPDFIRRALVAKEELVTYIAVPLITKGISEGVLEIFSRTQLEPDADWLDFLKALATQAAIAIENARLFSETQHLLEQTKDHAQQIQQIMDTVPEGMLLLDEEQRIILANPTAREYLELLAEVELGEVLTYLAGRPVEELLEPPSPGLKHELTLAGPPHQIFEVDTEVVATGPQAGGHVLVIRDVTQERETQRRAQQQERLAAVGQLAAGIAHDLNNVLTGIIGFAELAQLQPDDLREIPTRIIEQGRRASQLISQVLDFSRQSVAEKSSMDPVPLIKENLKLLDRLIPENIPISLKVDTSCESCTINTDPAQFQQMLTNLAVNARDAMPDGGQIEIRLSRFWLTAGEEPPCPDMAPGEWLVLSVSDTGSGIDPEIESHIFEPFYTTKEVGKGTGLGLAQVYGIIKQHGGEIAIESRRGEGTTFNLYFPVSSRAKKERPPRRDNQIPSGRGEVVLLVEDDPAVLDVVERFLSSLGYRVLTATDGQEALEVYEAEREEIALILTDVTMPKMGGTALLKTLQERNSTIKAVAMTGYSLEAVTKGLLSQGFAAELQKPLSIREIAQTVREVLDT